MIKSVTNLNLKKYIVNLVYDGVSHTVRDVVALSEDEALKKAIDMSGIDKEPDSYSVEECIQDDNISLTESTSSKWNVTIKLNNGDTTNIIIDANGMQDAEKLAKQQIRVYANSDDSWKNATVENIEIYEDNKENESMRVLRTNSNLSRNAIDDKKEVTLNENPDDMDINIGGGTFNDYDPLDFDDSSFIVVGSGEDDSTPPKTLEDNAIASLINDLIVDEFEAVNGYNSAIATANEIGRPDIVKVFADIANEENVHIGQLQKLLTLVSTNANSIGSGFEEAEAQLNRENDKVLHPVIGNSANNAVQPTPVAPVAGQATVGCDDDTCGLNVSAIDDDF